MKQYKELQIMKIKINSNRRKIKLKNLLQKLNFVVDNMKNLST